MRLKYKVLSPDGFDTTHECKVYTSLKQAKQALAVFVDRYKTQGYYSQACYNGYVRQIPLNQLSDYCDIITL